jgi:hypothetical protein
LGAKNKCVLPLQLENWVQSMSPIGPRNSKSSTSVGLGVDALRTAGSSGTEVAVRVSKVVMVAFAERVERNSSHNSGWWLPTLETDFSSDPEGAGPDEKP